MATVGHPFVDPREVVDAAYRQIGSDFDKHRSAPWTFVVEWLMDNPVRLAEHPALLVAGCGHGRHVRVGMQAGYDVTGIDINDRMVDAAGQMYEGAKTPQPKLLVADVCNLPMPNITFDAAICIAVLHHLPFELSLQAMTELTRVLCVGGEMLVSCWDPSAPSVQKGEQDEHNPYVRWIPWQLPNGERIMRYYHLPPMEDRLEEWSTVVGLELVSAELLDQNQVMCWRRH